MILSGTAMPERSIFAEIVIPVPVDGVFTYEIPISMVERARVGQSVIVPFGEKKLYTGIIASLTETPPEGFKIKSILDISDDRPTITAKQLELWQWTATYYMCPIGDVYKAAVPVGLRPDSQSKVLPVREKEPSADQLGSDESAVFAVLTRDEEATIEQLAKITKLKNIIAVVKRLVDKDFALITEELRDVPRQRLQKVVRLSERITDADMLNRMLALLTRSKKQHDTLNWIAGFLGSSAFNGKSVQMKIVIEKVPTTPSVIKSLIEKGFLVEDSEDTTRLQPENSLQSKSELNPYQQQALDEIHRHFETKQTVLLHGITGSGKTEIYIHLIDETLKTGRRVLYLLPEIALTTQIVQRLKRHFGGKVGVYHSKYSSSERAALWKNQLYGDEPYQIVLGVRSSIFLPMDNLGLVIVDEEHENSYKQFDPAPRYNARDLAVVLAMQHKAKVLLGSATPSLESYFNAKQGRYGLVELTHRHGAAVLPEIEIVDTKLERRKKLMKQCFSQTLLSSIDNALSKDEQVILFQNRRGYSPFLECTECGYVPKCKHCDVSLTYHKGIERLVCHYCGYSVAAVTTCDHCHQSTMRLAGFGTERIEDELKQIFPQANIARLDTDTTRTKHGGENIIRDFQERRINILIGTQMVSKGLDFGHVNIVGILNADNMLSFPDFRAYERSFQLMAQVSGRAGRKDKTGKVIIQTSNPENSIIRQVVANDYQAMYDTQMAERTQFFYPPVCRFIYITLKHRDRQTVEDGARELFGLVSKVGGITPLGPTTPAINRIQNLYLMNITIKLSKADTMQSKLGLQQAIDFFLQLPKYKNVMIMANVDPM
ncbi:MAG: primosomal protein N' [Salinivirgaceae bacterium]|nr:primosomal protein N' [Salinivirgaceae bacterium]